MASQVWKRIFGWMIAVAVPLILGISYYFILLYIYVPSDDLYNFPVPRNAEIVRKTDIAKSYDWSSASEENGIPFGYELVIRIKGWEKEEREGALVSYTKGNRKIDLISTRGRLDITKVD